MQPGLYYYTNLYEISLLSVFSDVRNIGDMFWIFPVLEILLILGLGFGLDIRFSDTRKYTWQRDLL